MNPEKKEQTENKKSEGMHISLDKQKVYPILKFLASAGGRILLTVVFAAIIYGLLIAMLETDNTVVLGIILVVCGYFGWKSLNKITPNLFLWMPLASWAIYYLVKGLLSIIIGAFIAPVWIGKKISSTVMEYVDVGIETIGK